MIDTHCHLQDEPLCHDVPAVLARARAAGVEAFVVPGVDEDSSRAALALAGAHADVWAAVGLHPWRVAAGLAVDLERLRELAAAPRVVALGEIGLDGALVEPNLVAQREALRVQVELARDLDLPVLIHSRGATDQLLDVLGGARRHDPGVLHSFGGSAETAHELVRRGWVLGVGGVVSRPWSKRARAAIASVPLEYLVLETDAPWIGTRLVPKGAVEPCHLPEIRAALAELKGVDEETVERTTTAMSRRVLGLA